MVLPGVAIVSFIGVSLVRQVDPEYEAYASTVLYLRDDRAEPGREPGPRNPLASGSGQLVTMAELVDEVLSDPSVRSRIEEGGLSADYGISVGDEAPILSVTASAGDRRRAIETANHLLDEIDEALSQQQDTVAASPEVRIEALPLQTATSSSTVTVARNRAIVSVGVAGLLVVIGVALLAERIARARRGDHPSDA